MTVYTQCRLHVASGTGNTFRVARDLAAVCTARDVPATLVPLTGKGTVAAPAADTLIGVLTPTHGLTAPWGVIRAACRLPRGGGAHAFVVATRGALAVGPWIFPGAEGTAAYLLALILACKGYRVRGVLGVDMPVNWIAVHPGLGSETVNRIVAAARPKTAEFMRTLLAGQTHFDGWPSLILGLVCAPVSAAYLLMGRFYLAKLFFASTDCTGCGLCARTCPFGAIRMCGADAPRPYWTFSCESCMRCMAYCPTRAIETSPLWAVLLILLAAGPWFPGPFTGFATRCVTAVMPAAAGRSLTMLAEYAFALLVIGLAYPVFWWLARIRVVNRLLTFTSFTRRFRRYHEPDVQLKDLAPSESPRTEAAP